MDELGHFSVTTYQNYFHWQMPSERQGLNHIVIEI